MRPAILRSCALLHLLACGGGGSPGGGTGPGGGSVTSIQISGGAATINVGTTTTFSAIARDGGGSLVAGASFSWNSSAPTVASVSASGVVSGLAVGTATITASSGGATASAAIGITADETPASITLAPSTPATLVAGTTLALTATVRAPDGHVVTFAAVSYSSSDPAVATVSFGVVTAGKAGTAVITATSGTVSATVSVTVIAGAASQLALRTQPAGTVTGSPLTTQPVVEIRDKGGNLVTSTQGAITVSTTTGGGTLTGTTTVPIVNGVATFTDLAITGIAGARALMFTSPGLASVTSSGFTLEAPAAPLIVADTTSVALTLAAGASQSLGISIRNGGIAALTGVTADAPVYDAGQATGWLTAIITGTAAPYLLGLQISTSGLATGSYRAVVRINGPGASNSPLPIVVSITVTPGNFLTFGAATEKLRILDLAAAYTPALSARDGGGNPTPPVSVSYASRATSVATVDAQGKITARGEGQTWVVASGLSNADSVYVIVPRSSTGPVLRSDLLTYVAKAGAVTTINVLLDTRSTPVGAVSIAVGYTTATTVFTSVSITVPTGPPVPVVTTQQQGVYRISAASATPLTGQIALLQLSLVARTAGTNGIITLTVTEIVAPDGTDLLPVTTSTRIPIIVQ